MKYAMVLLGVQGKIQDIHLHVSEGKYNVKHKRDIVYQYNMERTVQCTRVGYGERGYIQKGMPDSRGQEESKGERSPINPPRRTDEDDRRKAV